MVEGVAVGDHVLTRAAVNVPRLWSLYATQLVVAAKALESKPSRVKFRKSDNKVPLVMDIIIGNDCEKMNYDRSRRPWRQPSSPSPRPGKPGLGHSGNMRDKNGPSQPDLCKPLGRNTLRKHTYIPRMSHISLHCLLTSFKRDFFSKIWTAALGCLIIPYSAPGRRF
jgi:hypothetical protein